MAWPKTGTVSVTNGSAVVTGTGTSFFGSAQAGWGFVGPDGRVYEVLTADSPTQITLASNYQGATAAGQVYSLFPTMSLAHDLVATVQALISNFQAIADGPGAGLFADLIGFLADQDTGVSNPAPNEIGLDAGGVLQLALKGGNARGAAVQSNATDTGAGKLLLMGAFGLGMASVSTPPNNDISDGLPSGFYTTDGNTAGTGSETPLNGALLHVARGDGSASPGGAQLWQRGSGPLLYRRFSAGVPTDWASLIGIRGSNVNGEYVKLPDGTMICWRECAVNVASTGGQAFPFAAMFTDGAGGVADHTHVSTSWSHQISAPNAALEMANIRSAGHTGTDFVLRLKTAGTSVNPADRTERMTAMAIGRWD